MKARRSKPAKIRLDTYDQLPPAKQVLVLKTWGLKRARTKEVRGRDVAGVPHDGSFVHLDSWESVGTKVESHPALAGVSKDQEVFRSALASVVNGTNGRPTKKVAEMVEVKATPRPRKPAKDAPLDERVEYEFQRYLKVAGKIGAAIGAWTYGPQAWGLLQKTLGPIDLAVLNSISSFRIGSTDTTNFVSQTLIGRRARVIRWTASHSIKRVKAAKVLEEVAKDYRGRRKYRLIPPSEWPKTLHQEMWESIRDEIVAEQEAEKALKRRGFGSRRKRATR